MNRRRGFLVVLMCIATWFAIGLANVGAEPKVSCPDIAGCQGGGFCGAGASDIVDCDMVCIGGGTVACDPIEE